MRTIRLFLAQLLFTCCILGSLQSYACSSGPTFMSGCYYTDATGHQHFTLDITIACPTGSVYMWIHTASGGIIGPIATSGSTFVSSDGREGYDFINPSPVPTGSCYTIEFALTNNESEAQTVTVCPCAVPLSGCYTVDAHGHEQIKLVMDDFYHTTNGSSAYVVVYSESTGVQVDGPNAATSVVADPDMPGYWDYYFPMYLGETGGLCYKMYVFSSSTGLFPSSAPPPTAIEVCPCCNPHFKYTVSNTSSVINFSAESLPSVSSYIWNFGDGSPNVSTSSVPITYAYGTSGSYNVHLTVNNYDGTSCAASANVCPYNGVIYSPSSPGAFSIGVTPGANPSIVAFSYIALARGNYNWDFGDGSPVYTAVEGTHTYSSTGSYRVTMTITDPSTGAIMYISHIDLCLSAYGPKPGRGANGPGMTQNPSNEDELLSMISIAPNPASDNTMLKFDLAADQTNMNVQLIDITGRMIKNVFSGSLQAGTQRINIPTADLNSGYYFVKITTSLGTTTERLSVVK